MYLYAIYGTYCMLILNGIPKVYLARFGEESFLDISVIVLHCYKCLIKKPFPLSGKMCTIIFVLTRVATLRIVKWLYIVLVLEILSCEEVPFERPAFTNVGVHMNVVPRSTGTQIVEQRINSEV